ncbi:MAG: hypothetical protein CBE33_02820 [Candidatus Pelagibacter sp. TMED273]|nr:MAG: hypothetical protein CBE33_02820 [Candidatus Pelagibacter sp. TMED273]|tara:strand:- start:2547 stop:4118 length:1572 start_codon:yes stop_codon:yes gene_type:complete
MNNFIKTTSDLTDKDLDVSKSIYKDFKSLYNYFKENTSIDISNDKIFIELYEKDWSNMEGYADLVARPKDSYECSLLMYHFSKAKISITISAGKTNLTGSATPNGGIVINTELMLSPNIQIDYKHKTTKVPVGEILEKVRDKILKLSNNSLYYPVDPTSRKDARIGGTISCNASGFIPGEKGATRYWVESIELVLLNGKKINAKRGQYTSKDNEFIIDGKIVKVPTYTRPKIKNASGIYSADDNQIDFVDLIIGSEGILGLLSGCELRLDILSKNHIDFFIPIDNEALAIKFYHYISKFINKSKYELKALEYFGHNSQNYMKNSEFLFDDKNQVGIYMQIPIYDKSIEDEAEIWIDIINNSKCNLDINKILILNQSDNWDKFFEARHSIPVNALEKTIRDDAVSIITDTIVPPKYFEEFLSFTHKLIKGYNFEYLLFGHLGDCHLHFHLIHSKEDQQKANDIYNQIIKESSNLGGVYSAEHGTGKRKRNDFIDCYGLEAVNQIKLCKESFDSYMLLNRGNIIE